MLLESGIGQVWVQGEISNLSRPSSGHWYFSLKDRDAQLRCAMFRTRNTLCALHAARRPAGDRLRPREPVRAARRLSAAGRASGGRRARRPAARVRRAQGAAGGRGPVRAERKRALPPAPRRIGVITSPTGAAIRDILHILARRFPAAAVLIYPVPVQGAAAAPAIVAALELACGARRVRRADPGARRRLARGSVGIQRRARGARDLSLPRFRS